MGRCQGEGGPGGKVLSLATQMKGMNMFIVMMYLTLVYCIVGERNLGYGQVPVPWESEA